MTKLTIFYDGNCPLCVAEMDELVRCDKDSNLLLENIYREGFSDRYPHIDIRAANDILHGLDEQGKVLLGLDVTARAWKIVGEHGWIQVLRWPLIRWLADWGYLLFAKHRKTLSNLATKLGVVKKQAICRDNQCKKIPD